IPNAAAALGWGSKTRPTYVAENRTDATAELPRATVDTSEVKLTGRTIHVTAGEDFQAALDQAKPGDSILLDPGQTYRGPFQLPKKDGDGWILIGSAASRGLPA